jgi:hypothetical protein
MFRGGAVEVKGCRSARGGVKRREGRRILGGGC